MSRVVNFRDSILYPMARTAGFEPEVSFPTGEAAAMIDEINSRVRYGWEFYDWAEFEITEERAFRQVWDEIYTYATDEELYYIPTDTYYTVLGNTTEGQSPETNPELFEELDPVTPIIEYEQFGKQAMAEVVRINDANPITTRYTRSYPFTPNATGVDVYGSSGFNTVWVTFKARQPEFSFREYDEAAEYVVGDIVYDPDAGECYRALRAGTGAEIAGDFMWYKQEMPYLLAQYVKMGEAPALYPEVDRQMRQGERIFYGLRDQRYALDFWNVLPVVSVPIEDEVGATNLTESGVWPIPEGASSVTVPFLVTKLNDTYSFEYLYASNSDPDADFISVTPTAQTVDDFTVDLSATALVGGYSLHWKVIVTP